MSFKCQTAPPYTAEEVKRAYRVKVMEAHPDKGGTRETFEKVRVAASVLSDDAKRRDYDLQIKLNGQVRQATR